jgi:hypothetical protein
MNQHKYMYYYIIIMVGTVLYVQWRPLIWKHQDFSIVNCLSL